jgi:3-methyladenine DNA glycosylase AlkC
VLICREVKKNWVVFTNPFPNAMEITEAIHTRKGARSFADLRPEVVAYLNQGKLASANLVEWLAIDHYTLLGHALQEVGLPHLHKAVWLPMEKVTKITAMKCLQTVGPLLAGHAADHPGLEPFFRHHVSDTLRCYGAYMSGYPQGLSFAGKLKRIRPYAADPHFGVREIAWMAIRQEIIAQTEEALRLLSSWVFDPDPYIRRFASESTRPRGVWCNHIPLLVDQPSLGFPLLDPLHADPEKYVQDSVGNWLNDAARKHPEQVADLCRQWVEKSGVKATQRIAMKATRSLGK